MSFVDFCRERGVIIDALPAPGRWARYATEDKPRSDNGAVKWMGDVGFVQNWATMTEPEVWKADSTADPVNMARVLRHVQAAQEDKARIQAKAAVLATNIVSRCTIARHPYLELKGYPEAEGMVYRGALGKDEPEQLLLAIPMRIGSRLVGIQRIAADGVKKFLFGQETTGAEYRFEGIGPELLCEGYATGLSVKAALTGLRVKNPVRVCFSAHNVKVLSERMTRPHGIVADNDESGTGSRYATEAGIPFWMSPIAGEDFNDASKRMRQFGAGQALRKLLTRIT